jgi:cell wall assembly regulator SMI1
VQKFTRPITREIEVGGERLALTLTEAGITVRPVGSRRPPREITWGGLLCHLTGQELGTSEEPGADHLSRAVGALKSGTAAQRAAPPTPAPAEHSEPTPAASPAAEKHARTPDYTALLSRLERWLAEHRPKYLHALHPGASAAELDALQTELGRPLPAGLRTLLAWHNGQKEDFTGQFEENWMLLGTQGIATAKKELDGGEGAGDRRDWIPFGEDDGGDFLCVDAGDPAEPVREFWLGKPAEPPVAPSLATWLEQYLAALERGEYHEDPERGAFLRTSPT